MNKANKKFINAINSEHNPINGKYNMQGYNNTCLCRTHDGHCPICNYKWEFDVDIYIPDWYRGKPCRHCGWGKILDKPRVGILLAYTSIRLWRMIKWWFKMRMRNIYRIISV